MLEIMSNPPSLPDQPDRASSALENDPSFASKSAIPPDPCDAAPVVTANRRWKRRWRLPILLFFLTCASTFWVGANVWFPMHFLEVAAVRQTWMPVRETLVTHWLDGLIYMTAVLAILLTHEMGHFLATIRYRIPASLPIFLPFPISPIGTFGAVIGMDGRRADRREMFDIGMAGPLAGLVVAVPIVWFGMAGLDFPTACSSCKAESAQGAEICKECQEPLVHGPFAIDLPIAMRMILDYTRPEGYQPGAQIAYSQLTPLFMAGWVGLLITGLNMLPVSQLDGGHIIYTLFGRRAHWIARGFMVFAIAYIVFAENWKLGVMVFLVLLMGTDHPPTRDDNVRLGPVRTILGYASLLIPILCFAPRIIILRN